MGNWKIPWGKWRCGLSDEAAVRTEEHGMNRPSVGLQGQRLMGRSGSSGGSRAPLHSAETTLMGGLWQECGSKGRVLTSKACGPQPAVTFSHERKLALEYGWDYFMIIHKSFSDDMNPLMRWSCDKIHCKAINFSADDFLEGGKKLFSRKVACGWLPLKCIFCSSAERSWNRKPDSSCGCTCLTVLGKATLGWRVAWDRKEEGCIYFVKKGYF